MNFFTKQIILILVCLSSFVWGKDEVYQTADDFIKESFSGETPSPNVIWLDDEMVADIKGIMGRPYSGFRVRYWQSGERTLWILEEIGKVKPITVGFVVLAGKLERVKVLIYRESHGWEVKHPFFTNQFNNAELTSDHELTRNIDGISGATLSVNALKKLSRLALYLDQAVRNQG
jgi:hypothetical protein